jgi:iron complex transport system ATP-binding protein
MVTAEGLRVCDAVMGYRKGSHNRVVLRNVSFLCGAGTMTGVVGLNGSGKSSLLKSVSGLIPLLGGSVEIAGRPLHQLNALEVAQQVSVVLTEKISGFNLDVFSAVAAGQLPYTNAFHRIEPKHEQVINDSLALTGMADAASVPLEELSDGMFQKTMIARALAQQTRVMLLDEPLAYLDYGSRHELLIMLRRLCAEQGKCILLTTHDLDLMIKYCDRVIIVSDGGATSCVISEALNHPSFVRIGGGFLPGNN